MNSITHSDSGALEESHHDSHRFEYQTNTFQTAPLGHMLDDSQAQALTDTVHTAEGDEMWLDWEREQAIEFGVDKRPDERVDPDRQDMTTAVIERINGEQDELERQYETAHRAEAAEFDRARACREEVTSDTYYEQTTADERPEVDSQPENPFEELTQDEVSAVNKSAAQLYDLFEHEVHMGRASISRLLALRVARGQSPTSAVLDLKAKIEQFPNVRQPIANIDPFSQYQTTIEGTVDVLWSPKGAGQRQVGLITDETNTPLKVTVWQRSGRKPTLREGDRVRIERGKVNAYRYQGDWATSIAVDSEARIIHLEHGEGDAPRRKVASDEARVEPWSADSRPHAWANHRETTERDDVDVSDERVEAVNAWVRGEITIDEFMYPDE